MSDAERRMAAERLRTLGDTFAQLAAEQPTTAVVLRDHAAQDAAGKLCALAQKRGWLRLGGLAALVEWAESPPTPSPRGKSQQVPCPANLFLAVAGLHQVRVRPGPDGWVVEGVTSGGLLPESLPAVMEGHAPGNWSAGCLHHATVCRWLAEEIGDDEPPTAVVENLSGEAKALALKVQHPEWTHRQIAEAVPCDVRTLHKWMKYKQACEALASGRQRSPRGAKGRDGTIEAWGE